MVEAAKGLRLVHLPVFGLLSIVALVTMSIAASLVAHWNNYGYPSTKIRDRSRICLVAAIWTSFFALYFLFGALFAPSSIAFGIFAHLVTLGIGFILFLIGAATITAAVRHVNCGDVVNFSRCNVTKGLEVMSWITWIILAIALLFIFFVGVKARSGPGFRRGTLTNA